MNKVSKSSALLSEVLSYTKHLTIMYVEDDQDVGHAIQKLFKRFFNNMHFFNDPILALEYYIDHYSEIDLVITDIIMPHINGIELSRRIKQINPHQKIIIHSAHNDSALLKEIDEIGVNAFIAKPPTSGIFEKTFLSVLKNDKL